MMTEYQTLKFYKHSNNRAEIGWNHTSEIKNRVGPNLQQLLRILHDQGLQERAHLYIKEGNWSGDLYVIHKRLFKFQNEISRFMGDSGSGGPLIANVYDVTLNSPNGWAQNLSLVMKAHLNDEITQKLTELNFTPKHSDLAIDNRVSSAYSRPELWLDEMVEFTSPMPRN